MDVTTGKERVVELLQGYREDNASLLNDVIIEVSEASAEEVEAAIVKAMEASVGEGEGGSSMSKIQAAVMELSLVNTTNDLIQGACNKFIEALRAISKKLQN